MASVPRLLAAAVVAALVAGCGSASDPQVQDVARDFYGAVDARDGGAACALLAPRTRDELEQSSGRPCPEAILEEDLPAPGGTDQVSRFGTAAQVRHANDTTFLSRFESGWLVVAVGCSRAVGPGQRYDCRVKGG